MEICSPLGQVLANLAWGLCITSAANPRCLRCRSVALAKPKVRFKITAFYRNGGGVLLTRALSRVPSLCRSHQDRVLGGVEVPGPPAAGQSGEPDAWPAPETHMGAAVALRPGVTRSLAERRALLLHGASANRGGELPVAAQGLLPGPFWGCIWVSSQGSRCLGRGAAWLCG